MEKLYNIAAQLLKTSYEVKALIDHFLPHTIDHLNKNKNLNQNQLNTKLILHNQQN